MKMKNVIISLLITGFCLVVSTEIYSTEKEVATRFTDFFIGGASTDFHPSFTTMSSDADFSRDVTQWVQAALGSIPHLNFIPLDPSLTGAAKVSTKVEPSTLFIRGLVTRGDIKKVAHFSTDEYVVSTNVTLEFFDLVSGEVFYTRTLTGQVFEEKPKGSALSSEEIGGLFRACLKGTVGKLVEQIGGDYQPGVIEGHIVAVLDTSNVVLDLGRADGIYQGMTFYFYDNVTNPPVGIIRTEAPQERICSARIVIRQGGLPKRAWTVKSFGVNRLNQRKAQTRYMVAGFFPADPEHLPPDFNVDQHSLGQWLHDGLSNKTDLLMLAPLLAKLDSKGEVQLQEAMFQGQMNYSIFGGLAQSVAFGNRAFPDVMVQGLITHAGVRSFITPGADNKILDVGVSIEFYDRKTRDFLYSCQHSGRKVEKIVKEGNKVYRDVDLEASFRDVCKDIIREASAKIGEDYRPEPVQGRIVSVGSDNTFTLLLQHKNAGVGDLFNMVRETEKIKSLTGEDLGAFWRTYGMAKLAKKVGEHRFVARLLVSDGVTQIRKNDLLRAEGKHKDRIAGRLCRVVGWHVKGKVSHEYHYSNPRLTEWLHDALLSAGTFRLLPPNFREAHMATAEVGLASGAFVPTDHREIIYQGVRVPEIFISGRLGLADVTRKTGEFKDVLNLRSGVEVTFTNTKGDTLWSKKLAGSRELEQVKSRGAIVTGTEDLSPEFDSLTQNTIHALVRKIMKEYPF